jgi:hypothetical protein
MANKTFLKAITTALLMGLLISSTLKAQETWPPALPSANEKGVATISTSDFLKMPAAVQHVLDSNAAVAKLTVAKAVPVVELTYHQGLPNAALNGTGWSSWGDICLASDGKVYSGIGNHWKTEKGQAYIYCWDPVKKEFNKIVDLNKVTGAKPGDVHFSKVHAHIIEGRDKKIYFTGTLDDGGKAGSKEMLEKWNTNIAGGKLFQYDPATGKAIVYANFPPARVTATMKYDANRNILYCALEGDTAGFAFGAFDMNTKQWIYQSAPGVIGNDRNFIMDSKGNVYFNGVETEPHKELRLKSGQLIQNGKMAEATSMLPTTMFPGAKKVKDYTTLWKYDPTTQSISATNTYFKSEGIRSSTRETKDGYVYGTTMAGELFKYAPAKDELTLLGSNFLSKGEYITVCDLSPDEKYIYYLPGAHGSAGFSGTPVIQYDIAKGQQKVIAFLSDPMTKAFNYNPGGTYGVKVSNDGSKLYVGLNGSPPDALRPKGLGKGFGLTSFAVINIPASERGGK